MNTPDNHKGYAKPELTMTHNTREWETEFDDRFEPMPDWMVGKAFDEEAVAEFNKARLRIKEFLHHQLQKVTEAYWTHLESCATGTSEDGKVLYVRVDKEHFDQALKTRDSIKELELQKAREEVLETLKKEILSCVTAKGDDCYFLRVNKNSPLFSYPELDQDKK